MRDTGYATELKTAEDAAGQRIERLYVKGSAREEIRFSWWKDGQLVIRPLDLPEDELLALMGAAIERGVFKDEFLVGLYAAIGCHLNRSRFEHCLDRLRRTVPISSETARAKTLGLLAVLDRLEPLDEEWPEIDDPPPEPVQL